MTVHPHERPAEEMVNVEIPKADWERLQWLMNVLRNIDGWCRVNRVIGKYVFVAMIAAAIFLWKGIDAINHLIGWARGH